MDSLQGNGALIGAAVAVPAVIGALGLYQANQQASSTRRAQQEALKQSKDSNAPITEALWNMLQMAKEHDFRGDTLDAVRNAEGVGTATLQKALQNLNARYRAGGGVPGNSSEFNVKAMQTSRGVLDPLRLWAADQFQNEFGRKMAAFQAVNGGNPGSLSSDYWKYAASLPQANFGTGLSYLNQALNSFLNPSSNNNSGGAGGSGDFRYPNSSPYPTPPAGTHYEQDENGNWVAVRDY